MEGHMYMCSDVPPLDAVESDYMDREESVPLDGARNCPWRVCGSRGGARRCPAAWRTRSCEGDSLPV